MRQYILQGKPEGVARLFINKSYLQACQQGPHQHSIAIAARRDKHRVDAIVRLFGELTYFVVLSDHYDGADLVGASKIVLRLSTRRLVTEFLNTCQKEIDSAT